MIPPSKSGFGIVSAFGNFTDIQNFNRHNLLLEDLRSLKYKPEEVMGEWDGFPAQAWMVPEISIGDLTTLARRYQQETAVFCSPGGHPRVLSISGTIPPKV